MLTGVLLRGFSSRTEPLSREKREEKKSPSFRIKEEYLPQIMGSSTVPMDSVLTQNKKGVAQVCFISRLLGRQLEYNF